MSERAARGDRTSEYIAADGPALAGGWGFLPADSELDFRYVAACLKRGGFPRIMRLPNGQLGTVTPR